MPEYKFAKVSSAWYENGNTFSFRRNDIFFRDISAGPAMLAIHGFPTSGCDWSPIAQGLYHHFRLIVPDLIDYGRSRNRSGKTFHIHDQADMIEALFASLEIETAHLLAHDVGDTVAQELLARHIEGKLGFNIDSLVLMNGGILPSEHRPRPVQYLLLSRVGPLAAMVLPVKKFGAALAEVFGPDTRPDATAQMELWNISLGANGRRSLARRIHYMTDRKDNEERWVGALKNAEVRILMINGVDDPVSGGHVCDALAAQVPEIEIVRLEGIGHFPLLEAPAECVQHILDFHASDVTGKSL